MHAATLTSDRLQRVNRLLSDGRPHSTRDISRRTRVLAISACVAEIVCNRETIKGKGVFFYTMLKGPTES